MGLSAAMLALSTATVSIPRPREAKRDSNQADFITYHELSLLMPSNRLLQMLVVLGITVRLVPPLSPFSRVLKKARGNPKEIPTKS